MSKLQTAEEVRQKWAQLRDIANLEATAIEIQEANETGDLVARNRLKIHNGNGQTWYEPGQPLPYLDQRHRVLQAEKLVTTASRWEGNQQFKRLDAYIQDGQLQALEARLKHSEGAISKAQQRLAQLENDTKAAQAELVTAQKEHETAVKELETFAQKAPVN